MEKIYLSKSYLKNPAYAVSALLIALFSFEGLNWLFSFEKKIAIVKRFGGFFGYSYIILRGMILPELVTILIIIALLNLFHRALKIHTVNLSWSGILRYELLCLPVLAIAFFFFSPITQSIRFLLVEFPAYNFSLYWENYIVGTYNLRGYLIYLIPVLLMGYLTLNASLLNDFIKGARMMNTSGLRRSED